MTRPHPVPAPLVLLPPDPQGWDFGDYNYALEPLTLPHPHHPGAPPGALSTDDVQGAFLRLAEQNSTGLGALRTAAEDSRERLFWFRWITGHHISFILWRLIADALDRLAAGEDDPEELTATITHYVRGYGRALLYTGSVPRTVYTTVIRPGMHRHHTAFSGTWAPDYQPVRRLLRGHHRPHATNDATARLEQQVHSTRRLHLDVASKLVPSGRSLLAEATTGRRPPRPRARGTIFDCYFLTVRAPVSQPQIAAQLLRRHKALAIDLATNHLHPGGTDDPPGRPRSTSTPRHVHEITEPLLRAAGLAAGLAPGRVDEELNRLGLDPDPDAL
ncbi:hypothetical protein [Saccharothrix xinjiangensis]|uniref:Uncharacterized protein n=1 Tax=Saccharothrix xinjiangensis TaxID=204798 RepID=A0ABV9YC69_9PSEU